MALWHGVLCLLQALPVAGLLLDAGAGCEYGRVCNSKFTVAPKLHGGFVVYNTTLGYADDDAARVEVEVVKVRELDANLQEVGNDHTVNLRDVKDDSLFTLPRGGPVDVGLGGAVPAELLRMHALLPSSFGEFEIQVYSLNGDGELTDQIEDPWQVESSDVLWKVWLGNWYWCGRCEATPCLCGDGVQGEYIDIAISVTGARVRKDPGEQMSLSGDTVNLGANVPMQVSDAIFVVQNEEGSTVDVEVPDGYPRFQDIGGERVLVIRVPYFVGEATYAFLIRMSQVNPLAIDFILDWFKVFIFPCTACTFAMWVVHCCRPARAYNNPLKQAFDPTISGLLVPRDTVANQDQDKEREIQLVPSTILEEAREKEQQHNEEMQQEGLNSDPENQEPEYAWGESAPGYFPDYAAGGYNPAESEWQQYGSWGQGHGGGPYRKW
jgi:hypothetical protein